MRKWLRRIRAALVLGLTWALGWGLVGGFIMEGIVDPNGRILDMWPQTLAIPGFLAGAVFSVLLLIAERRRRFDELSLPRFTALGAAGGMLLGGLVIGLGAASGLPLWLRAAVLVGPVTLLSAASAAGTLALARKATKRELPEGSADAADVVTRGPSQDRLGK